MARLYIQFETDLNGRIDFDKANAWKHTNDQGVVIGSGFDLIDRIEAELSEEHNELADLKCTAVVPDSAVLRVGLTIPGRTHSKLRRAAPYAIEPLLASDLETIHVAIGKKDAQSEKYPVVAINKDLLQTLIDLFNQTGLSLHSVTTPALALATSDRTMQIFEYSDSVTLVFDSEMAVLAHDHLESVLDGIFIQNDDDESQLDVQVFSDVPDSPLAIPQSETDNRINIVKSNGILESVVAGDDPAVSINLLQGTFEVTRHLTPMKKSWRKTIASFIVLMLITSVAFAIQGYHSVQQADELRQKSIHLYESSVGPYQGLSNPAGIVRRLRAEGGGSDDTFEYLLTVFTTADQASQVLNIRYMSRSLEMSIEAIWNAIEDLSELEQTLQSHGLEVRVHNVIQQPSGVRARVSFRI